LWDVSRRIALGEPLTGHCSYVYSVAFSPNGNTLASGSKDGTVRLWDVSQRKLIGEPLTGHSRSIDSLAFSPHRKIIASGSSDHTVRLWDVNTKKTIGEPLTCHSSYVYSVAFSPDGNTLASGSSDHTVRLWDVNPKSWLKRLCYIANRNFSQKEWHEYMGNEDHEKTCEDLPKDTLGAIELVKEAQELLKKAKKAEYAKAKEFAKEAQTKFAQAKVLDANMVFGED
jgi:WD40 repeat protein